MYLPYGLNPMARVPFIAKGVTRKECKNAPISLPMYKIKVSIEDHESNTNKYYFYWKALNFK
jgi:hypothetical protein